MNRIIILLLLSSFAFADRKTIYVSTSGDDSNSGETPCLPKKTISPQDQTDLMLKRGDTFTILQTISIAGSTNVGAYGTGPNPILLAQPTAGFVFSLQSSAHDLSIQNLTFDSTTPSNFDQSGAATAIQVGGKNVSISNCVIKNVNDFVNANGAPNGLSIIGNADAGPGSVRGYFVWVQGTNISIVNNQVSNSTRQHCIRVGGATNLAILGNDLQNLDRSNVDPQDISKATLNAQIVRNMLVAGNTSRSGGFGVGPLGGADGVAHPESKSENVILADNTFLESNCNVTSGVDYVLVRGNVSNKKIGVGYMLQPTDPSSPVYQSRTVNHVTFDSNVFNLSGADGNFLFVQNAPPPGSVVLTNNLMSAPALTTGGNQDANVFILAPDLTGFSKIAGNHWQTPVKTTWIKDAAMYVWPFWSDPRGYLTPAQWNANPNVSNEVFHP